MEDGQQRWLGERVMAVGGSILVSVYQPTCGADESGMESVRRTKIFEGKVPLSRSLPLWTSKMFPVELNNCPLITDDGGDHRAFFCND